MTRPLYAFLTFLTLASLSGYVPGVGGQVMLWVGVVGVVVSGVMWQGKKGER